MHCRLNVRVVRRSLLAVGAVVVGLTLGCSSPSGPTGVPAPPVGNPPVTPVNPASALSMSCPPNVSATSTTGNAIPITFAAPVVSGGVAPVQVSCTRQSGSPFTVGETVVQCTATDASPTSSSCLFTVTVNAVIPRLTRTRFMAFGDSTTAGEVTIPMSPMRGEGTPTFKLVVLPAVSYPTQLATMLRARYTAQASVIDVANAGLSGEWAEDGAKRLPGVMVSVRPEAVLLLEGVNDIAAQGSVGVTRAWQALDVMAKEIRNRGARVFIGTLPPSRPGGPKAVAQALITSLNERIKITATGEGAVLVDVHAALATDIPRYVGIDGLHLTEAGHLRVAELFFDAVRSDLEAR